MARSSATLDRQVARVRRRLFLQKLMATWAGCWIVALTLAAAWFLVEPYALPDAVAWLRWAVFGGLAGAGSVLAVVLAVLATPSRVAAALALDERFNLKERVTTTLMLSEAERALPAGHALVADVQSRIGSLRVRDRFPLRIPWLAALVPVCALVLVFLAFFYKPVLHPVGTETNQALADSPVAKAEIEKALRPCTKSP